MGNEKYLNYYIELITNTMQDAILRNVSLQTNSRISDEVIKEQSGKIEHLENMIVDFRNEVKQLEKFRTDYENIKHQVNHVDTFRSELLKERNEHEKTKKDYESKIIELNEKIESLQPTTAKRKKNSDVKDVPNKIMVIDTSKKETEKDGGIF
jgi:predicted nuclease with TOPRIM domain